MLYIIYMMELEWHMELWKSRKLWNPQEINNNNNDNDDNDKESFHVRNVFQI